MTKAPQSRVYIVDGDDAVRDSMRSLIGSLEVEARLYASAEALLAEADFTSPACVVTEVHLPGMSGIELQDRLRAAGAEVPVIVLASRSDVPTAVHALRSGAVDFIEKPFVDQVLVRSIRQALESQELERLTAGRPRGREIPFSRRARETYGLDDGYFSPWGTLLLAGPEVVRRVVHELNAKRSAAPEDTLRPGLLNALGLEQEFFQRLLDDFRTERDPRIMDEALRWLCGHFGKPALDETLNRFGDLFLTPPDPAGTSPNGRRVAGETARRPPRAALPADVAVEKLLLLWLANQNPAAGPLREMFDDSELAAATPYREMMASLEDLFEQEPSYGPQGESLFELLCAPIRSAPDSLGDQLEIVVETQKRLSGRFLDQLLVGLDVIKEEEKPAFTGLPGPPPAPSPALTVGETPEPARFSAESSWMGELVLIAKHVKVWLHQLSEATGRDIRRLDQVPDEELDRLAGRGFNGLWLVGLWQRSPASRRIKRQAGNPEAEASAYSLADYRIAGDLGGDEALADLERRALERGVRLACDVVPNHMGIDSPWLIEHPEWFLSVERCPFPGYSFTGDDLSSDPRVGIYLEDGYADRSDAAVVFRRVDRQTGEELFIYHGNDGTSLPWNDTAQLDYLNPQVREMMIDTLVGLARRFQVIRIDAAMTLVKQHVQRLWYPPPGEGGDIPSRAEHGLSREEFERRMPEEFWRQVVDRVAQEAPDTLLLAEGFWMMETHFVRNLGMHRVYNSAFMHHLRDEDNATFRAAIAGNLTFDPGVLARHVNFLTNPDEPPAIEQLGSGDKYFALATLLATLPGLPLFGHGQLEGLAEKYGMEYARAYLDEAPDPDVVARHERQIVPLLEHRGLFAGRDGFRLYDVEAADPTEESPVLEDVIAFSNHAGGAYVLVIVHNRDATVRGFVRRAVSYRDAEGHTVQGETLGQALGLDPSPGVYCRFRDPASGLEYLFASRDLAARGLEVELGPYESRVLRVTEVRDDSTGRLRQLAAELDGRGVPDLDNVGRSRNRARDLS